MSEPIRGWAGIARLRAVGHGPIRSRSVRRRLRLHPAVVATLAVALFASACRTPPPEAVVHGVRLAVDDARASRVLDDYLALSARRDTLRGAARVALVGPDFKLNRPQNVVVARPARLRFEVIGLFDQLAAVLVSDGESYGFYDAATGEMAHGPVTPDLLWNLAKVDLGVPETVGLLLGAPRPPAQGVRAAVWREEGERLGIAFTTYRPHRRSDCPRASEPGWRDPACFAEPADLSAGGEAFVFDGAGRLVELRAFEARGVLRYRARFDEYSPLDDGEPPAEFPLLVTIESPAVRSEARFAWKRVMLGGEVADRLFRLPDGGRRW